MSVVFVVVPVVAALPALTAAAIAVASTSGFTIIEQTAEALATLVETSENCAEIEMDAREELRKVLTVEGGFTLEKEDLTITFYASRESGKVNMVVTDVKKRSKEELKVIGQEMMNKIIQRYAYDRLMTELKKEGFTLVKEEREEDSSIHIKVRKW
jgi:hypothetical protein